MKRISIIYLFMILPLLVFPHNTLTKNFPETRLSQTIEVEKQIWYSGYQEEPSSEQRKISFRFSSIITNSDPGNGAFRYNRDSLRKVTYIFLDEFDLSGEDQTNWYMQWKKAASATGKVRINIVEAEGKNINVFYFKGVFVRENGYWRIPAEYISGSMPVDGEIYYFEIDKNKEPEEGKDKPESVVKAEESREVAAVTTIAEPERESQPIEPQKQTDSSVPEVKVPVEQSLPSPVNSEKQANPINPEQAATDNYPMPGQQRIVNEENKPEPQMQAEVTKESNPESAQALLEKEVVNTQAENQTVQPRTRAVQESNPAPNYQSSQQTQTKQESQPVQSTRTSQPTQPAPTSQPKTTTQSSQPQPAPVKKETPASQPAPKATQPASRPSQPSQPSQPSPATRYPTSPPATYGNVITKRTDGSRIFHGIIETGYGFKVNDYGINNYRINFIGSFSLGQHFMIGLGLGYRRYFDKPEKHTDWYLVSSKSQVPVFLDLRYLFSKKQLTPYLALGIGGTTEKSKSDTTSYGSFINPSAGIWYRMSKNTALFAGVAYEGLEMEFAKPVDNIPFRRKNSSVSLNIGIQF
ncbi:MAG: hypothetical protein IPN68_01770 [Bacteroidetes bacterium]|nr:hypothetical protein [Bacteroidota bacterium]